MLISHLLYIYASLPSEAKVLSCKLMVEIVTRSQVTKFESASVLFEVARFSK